MKTEATKTYKNLDINDLNGEIWKDINNYEGLYQVSNLSRIKSFIFWKGTCCRILKQTIHKSGYLTVNLYKNKQRKTKYVHILMFENFKEKIKKGYDIHHKDENKENNTFDNFELKQHSEHTKNHVIKENNPFFGKHHSEDSRRKISNSKIIPNQKYIDIKIDLKGKNLTQEKIAKKHGVSQTTISHIKNEKHWWDI